MLRLEKKENRASGISHQDSTPAATPAETKQDKPQSQLKQVYKVSCNTARECYTNWAAAHQKTKEVGEHAVEKTVNLEPQSVEYKWLKEVEVTLPKYFIQRKRRRMFLERVVASGGKDGNKK